MHSLRRQLVNGKIRSLAFTFSVIKVPDRRRDARFTVREREIEGKDPAKAEDRDEEILKGGVRILQLK